MKRLLTLLTAAALLLMANAAMAAIQNTPHDFAGVSGFGRCGVCHVPHAAAGANRLWRKANTGSIPATVWSATNVATLCAGCHDGGGLVTGSNAIGSSIKTEQVIFADTSHQGVTGNLATVDGFAGYGIPGSRPYGAKTQMECTTCHNVHFEGNFDATSPKRPFLRSNNPSSPQTSMTDFCADCHAGRKTAFIQGTPSATNHPVLMAYSSTVLGVDRKMVPLVSSMTKTLVALNDWSLGGKLEGNRTVLTSSANVGCQSCHSIHKPAAAVTSAGTALTGARQLLVGSYADSLVCEGCHGSNPDKLTGGSVGKKFGDHPYGTGGVYAYMTMDGPLWTGTDKNAAGGAVCTSCHKAHQASGGIANLRRYNSGVVGSDTDILKWCTSCHTSAAPQGHHSNTTNFAQSAISCGDCHSLGAGNVSAHNGFAYAIQNNVNSSLCTGCHTGSDLTTDPVAHLTVAGPWNADGTSRSFQAIPLGNLSVTGSDLAHSLNATTHYLGSWGTEANNGSLSTNPKTTQWIAGDALSVSKYGTDNRTMTCESCHSVKHNIGAQAGADATSGWAANLLLQAYKDDDSPAGRGNGNGSAFCVTCHNRGLNNALAVDADVQNSARVPDGTHPMTNWQISRAVDAGRTIGGVLTTTLVTGTGSYANASNPLPYPAANQMDCDSCHKPHLAAPGGTYKPGLSSLGAVSVILERAGNEGVAGTGAFTPLCQQCHTEGM